MKTLGGIMRTAATLGSVVVACLSLSCSSDNGIPGAQSANFTPLAPTPPSQSVTMQAGSVSGATFNIRIAVKDVTDFFGIAFHVTFNPNSARYLGFDSSTSFLNGAGIQAGSSFQVVPLAPPHAAGELAVVATRFQNAAGTIPSVNVTDGDVIILTFQATAETAGNTFNFGLPREVSGAAVGSTRTVVWTGGTLTAN